VRLARGQRSRLFSNVHGHGLWVGYKQHHTDISLHVLGTDVDNCCLAKQLLLRSASSRKPRRNHTANNNDSLWSRYGYRALFGFDSHFSLPPSLPLPFSLSLSLSLSSRLSYRNHQMWNA